MPDELQPRSSQILCEAQDFELQSGNATIKKTDLNRDMLLKELSRIQHIGPQSSTAHSMSFQYPTGSFGSLRTQFKFKRLFCISGQVPRNIHPMNTAYDSHQRESSDAQTLKKQQHELEKSVQESEFYRHRTVLPKLDMSSHDKHMMRPKFSDGLPKQRLDEDLINKGLPRDEDRLEMTDLRRQDSIVKGATNETLNQLYMNTLRKCEAIKGKLADLGMKIYLSQVFF